jgi:protein PsiE
MSLEQTDSLRLRINRLSEVFGSLLVDVFHYLALFVIGGAIVWSAAHAFIGMMAKGGATIDDILLLFIYLELGAMVGIYFKTNHMPVRFLIYVAMTALTRLLISDVQAHHKPDEGVIYLTGAILLLAVATLIIRFGSARFPSASEDAAKK